MLIDPAFSAGRFLQGVVYGPILAPLEHHDRTAEWRLNHKMVLGGLGGQDGHFPLVIIFQIRPEDVR
jgi:hypothetical protein